MMTRRAIDVAYLGKFCESWVKVRRGFDELAINCVDLIPISTDRPMVSINVDSSQEGCTDLRVLPPSKERWSRAFCFRDKIATKIESGRPLMMSHWH